MFVVLVFLEFVVSLDIHEDEARRSGLTGWRGSFNNGGACVVVSGPCATGSVGLEEIVPAVWRIPYMVDNPFEVILIISELDDGIRLDRSVIFPMWYHQVPFMILVRQVAAPGPSIRCYQETRRGLDVMRRPHGFMLPCVHWSSSVLVQGVAFHVHLLRYCQVVKEAGYRVRWVVCGWKINMKYDFIWLHIRGVLASACFF